MGVLCIHAAQHFAMQQAPLLRGKLKNFQDNRRHPQSLVQAALGSGWFFL
jgi:hypothetical protein